VNELLNHIFSNKEELETNLFVDSDVASYRQLIRDVQLRQGSYAGEKARIVERY
jgi:hypothetical protein